MKTYKQDVMEAVRQYLDLEPDNTSKDDEIMGMNKETVFEYYCKWNGLSMSWYLFLLDAVESIWNLSLEDRAENYVENEE